MRLTRNHAVHFSNKAATRFTRWPRLINSEHAQSMEVIVGVVMGQKVVRPKPDRPYRLLRLCSFRVFFQVQQWKGSGDELLPEEWGWRESDGVLIPVQTDLPPAPDDLLQVIRCNCQSDCSSLRCTCRKHNVKCSLACGNCRGSGQVLSELTTTRLTIPGPASQVHTIQ